MALDEELYQVVRGLAARAIASRGHVTIDPTELLHEAWMKVIGSGVDTENRAVFVAVSTKAMRSVLVDRARAAGAQKRGGSDQRRTTLSGVADLGVDMVGVLTLEDMLDELAEASPRAAKVVELRIYGGQTTEEVAAILGVSSGTVKGDWRFARALLQQRLQESGA